MGGGRGVVAEIFRDLNYRIGFSGGGGGVAEIFPVNKSLTFPRFRDIFLAFSGHLRIIRRLWTLPENSGTLHMSAYTFKPRNNINSFRKTTFTKSLGGAMAHLATPLVGNNTRPFQTFSRSVIGWSNSRTYKKKAFTPGGDLRHNS